MGKDNVQNDEVEIDIGHILSILWEKILLIIATGIIVGLAGFLVSKFLRYVSLSPKSLKISSLNPPVASFL